MQEVAAYDADPANRESTSAHKMYSGDNRRLNYGYKFLDALYERLGIASFIGRYDGKRVFGASIRLMRFFVSGDPADSGAGFPSGQACGVRTPSMAGTSGLSCLMSTARWITWRPLS